MFTNCSKTDLSFLIRKTLCKKNVPSAERFAPCLFNLEYVIAKYSPCPPDMHQLHPLYKCCFIRAVVASPFIEIQCAFGFRAREQHHLIAIRLDCQIFCMIQTGGCVTLSSVIGVGNNIFDKCIRTDIPCQIRDNHAHTG